MKKLGILIFNNAQPMDIIGPWEVFTVWQKFSNTSIELNLVAEHDELIQCASNITLKPHCSFSTAPQFDYFLVPGGHGRLQEIHNKSLLNFIEKQATNAQYVLSVCTGMFLLYYAGLLKNQSVTTYWRAYPELRQLQDIQINENRIVKNDKFWISGGVTSGIDLAIEFIADIFGAEDAGKTQLLLEYFPQSPIYAKPSHVSGLPKYLQHESKFEELPHYLKDLLK